MSYRSIAYLLLLALLIAPMNAQKRAFTLEDLYRVQGLSDMDISADGRLAAFTVTTSDLPRAKRVNHIWLLELGSLNRRQLTFHDAGESSPRFSPDGKQLAFLSSRNGGYNLFLLPLQGGEARQLTRISSGVSEPLWSPDGKSIVFSSDVYPECGADDSCNRITADRWEQGPLKAHLADSLLYRHWTAWKDGTRTHILLVDTESGQVRDLTPGNEDAPSFQLGGPLQYDFSPDSSQLVYVSKNELDASSSTNTDLWLLTINEKPLKPKRITSSNPAYDGSPKFSPDGTHIAFRMQQKAGFEADLFRLALYEIRTGTVTVPTETFRNWVEDFRWTGDSQGILFSSPLEGLTPIYRLELKTRTISQVFSDKTIDQFEIVGDSNRLVYIRRSTGEPAELFQVEIDSGKSGRIVRPVRLTHFNDALSEEVDIRPAESLWVEGSGGKKIQVFIVKPHGFVAGRKYPLILNVHGGPQMQWADAFRGDWQVYPGVGYIVAFPNPHGSTGYGQEFTEQISGDWGGRVFEDLMKITDALAALPYVDAGRIGAMGWSYGGYMMNWFEGHTDRFKAIASMMGIFNLKSMYGATEELWFPEWDLKGQPWNSELYEKWSPDKHVKNFKTPCLVISGERDYRVPYTQSLEFFTALQKMNVPSRLIIYSNAGHWPNWYEMALYYTAHLEWFHKYLGGGAPPWSTEDFLRNAVFDRETGRRIGK